MVLQDSNTMTHQQNQGSTESWSSKVQMSSRTRTLTALVLVLLRLERDQVHFESSTCRRAKSDRHHQCLFTEHQSGSGPEPEGPERVLKAADARTNHQASNEATPTGRSLLGGARTAQELCRTRPLSDLRQPSRPLSDWFV